MEQDSQSTPAAEAASGGQAEPTASAPLSATGGPASWEAAFAGSDSGASNRGSQTDRPATTAPQPASAASDQDAASNGDGAGKDADPKAGGDTPDGQRAPQEGSRRSTAAELEATRTENQRLQEQFDAWAKERDERRAADEKRATEEAAARAEAESFASHLIGKPGELAALLAKEADQGWLDNDDNERKLELIRGARAYQPLMERARADARAELGHETGAKLAEAEGRAQGLLAAWSAQFDAMEALDLPGFDGKHVRSTIDNLPGIVKAAHAAGAASRDGEIADLNGQLTDAKTRAFTSQPPLARGGVSGSGRTTNGYDPAKSPVSNLEEQFATATPASSNGRR